MKRKNAWSLLLCLALLLGAVLPATTAYAENNDSDKGMHISKTATPNTDGSYTITLEAYATGSKVISEVKKDIPTDIVLVLDQSGSMADNFSRTTEDSWMSYGRQKNSSNYDLRMNNSRYTAVKNLYYKLSDGSYVGVSIDRTSETVQDYVASNARNANFINSRYTLYANTDEGYKIVTVTSSGNNGYNRLYTYTYTLNDGSTVERTSIGDYRDPPYIIYRLQDTYQYVYEYYYTVNGVKTTIGTQSKGDDTVFNVEFYKKISAGTSITALEALQNAVRNFAGAVETKAAGEDGVIGTLDDINHRIAVVGFACDEYYGNSYYGYSNTEVFVGSDQYTYGTAAQGQYANAFQNMNTAAGVSNINASIGALDANGGTLTNLGLEMANGIFEKNPLKQDEKRNRVVIVFTDGEPGWSGYESATANAAITQAGTAKTTHGATVYTIGIFSGADATSAGNQNGNETQKANWFMQQVSSNNGKPQSPSYYLSAGDAASLNNIFQQISSQIEEGGSSTTLNSETVIKDIISPSFTLPAGATATDITLETYACIGVENDGKTYIWSNNNSTMNASATITSTDDTHETTTNNQVSVTGFNFAENYVGTVTENGNTTYRGNKLVISFNVKPRSGFLGGNEVITNSSAGVYSDKDATEPVLTFEQPKVDVTIKEPQITLPDANVYLGAYFEDTVSSEDLKNGTTIKFGDNIELDLTKPDKNWGLEDWQTEYVTIEVKITDKDGKEVTDFKKLTEDTEYKVSVSIKPKTDKTDNSGYDKDMTGTIHVFKPELTFKDSTAYYGETVPTDNNYSSNYVANSEKWKNGNKYSTDSDVKMLGEKPELSISYTPDADMINDGKYTKKDLPVKATVKIGTDDVTTHTTFQHEDCTGKTCTLKEGYHFWIHIQTCTLTVNKSGGNTDEPYVFTVYKGDVKYSEVTVEGNGSETIYELPVGTYTITEDTGWSWRYKTQSYSDPVELSAAKTSGEITCTNEKTIHTWLNGFSTVVRNIFGVKH